MRPLPQIRIGTAGWSIPRAVAANFADAGSHLERYAAVLSSTEINSAFHRPHRRSTYERWAGSVPTDFRFSVKIPKSISHEARLIDVDRLLAAFMDQVAGLGDKLAVLLLQLPPSFPFNEAVLDTFLTCLRATAPRTVDVACEPRHSSWFGPQAEACLIAHRAARVAASPAPVAGGEMPGGWAGLRYHRLHGSPRIYHSSYGTSELEALARTVATERQAGASCWCVFDNTASGAALANALELGKSLSF